MKRACMVILAAGLPTVAMGQDVVQQWNTELLSAVRTQATPPPKAARNLAMAHAAMFDAVNAITGTHNAYRFTAAGGAGASQEAAAAAAAHRVATQVFPGLNAAFDARLNAQLAAIPDSPSKSAGIAIGHSIADQMVSWRSTDGSGASVTYTPSNDPGRWRPTPGGALSPVLPQWPGVTPFAMNAGSQMRPPPPPALDSAEYTTAFNQVKIWGARDNSPRSTEQTQIARFWAQGGGTSTPPGMWNQIAAELGDQQGHSLADNARMFAMLNVALADAGIACWDAKYLYDTWRPVTAIREAHTDGNADTIADPNWTPLLTTPSFPEYTSGHSTFSSAAATVLANFFGTDAMSFTIGSDGLPGVERSFSSLWGAAEEAGMSRIYGGIHFWFGNSNALACGQEIGNLVARTQFTAIPAPGGLIALGAAGLMGSRRRRGA